MATVPRLTPGEVVSRPAAAVFNSGAAATSEAFGMPQAQQGIASGQAVERLGLKAIDVAGKTLIEDTEREAKDLDIQYSRQLATIGRGDGTPQNPGYYSQKGENAISGYAGATDAANKARADLLSKASNPHVKEMFGLSSKARLTDELGRMDAFRQEQRRVANDTTSQTRMNEAADDAAAGWNDPQIITRSRVIASGEVADMAQRNGWSPEVAASKRQEADTHIFRSAILAALERDPAAADKLYKDNKELIDGRARPEIEKALEVGVVRQQSQAEAARIQATIPGDVEAQVAEAKKTIKDPKVQDEAIQRLDRDHARDVRVREDNQRTLRRDAWQVITSGKDTDALTPAQLASLDGTTISAMKEFATKMAKDGNGYARATDPDVKNTLQQLFLQDKVGFANANLDDLRSKMTEPDYNYWQAQQRAVNVRDEKQQVKNESYSLANTISNEFLRSANINPTKLGSNAAKAQIVYDTARSVIDRMYEGAEGNKRLPIADQRKAVEMELKALFLKGSANGDWLSHRAFEYPPDQRKNFVVSNVADQRDSIAAVTGVPTDVVEKVVAGLKKANKPATLDNIRNTYRDAISRAGQ